MEAIWKRKETRFGIGQSALFTTITTAFTTGSVNSMHDSLTPLGGIVPMVLMMLNAVFGGEACRSYEYVDLRHAYRLYLQFNDW